MSWPKNSEYFTGTTFCVAVDSLNGLVYVAQVSKISIKKKIINTKETIACFTVLSNHIRLYYANCGICFLNWFQVSILASNVVDINIFRF